MIIANQKRQLKLTIIFSLFFILISSLVYYHFITNINEEVESKFFNKAKVFKNYLEQNPHFFWKDTTKTKDFSLLSKLVDLNDAKYFVLEDASGQMLTVKNLNVAEENFYITSDESVKLSDDEKTFKLTQKVYVAKMYAGKFYIGFDAVPEVPRIEKQKFYTALLSILILLTGVIITYYLALISFRPIIAISSALDSILKTQAYKKINYKPKGDFKALVEKINQIIIELERKDSVSENLNKKFNEALRDKLSEISLEINQRKRAEISLKKSEEQFRVLFESAPIGMVIISPEGKVVSANKSFSDTLGYKLEELMGVPIKMVFEKDELPFYVTKSSTNQNVLRLADMNTEKLLIKKDGTEINVVVKSVAITDDMGDVKHYIMQLLDVSEMKKILRELEYALSRAEQSDKLKSAFLAQMSHEIRTPLNVILTSVPLISDEIDETDEEMKLILESVHSAGKRLQRTIDMILNMSSVQSGNYKPEFEIFSVGEELKKLIYEFKSLSDNKGLELNLKILATNTFITADKYTVTQIFQNLISNAIKYTPKGYVDIIVSDLPNSKIKVEVKDSGIGMSREYLRNIFSPFSQENTGHKREYEGNGLGLALVKKYVEINQGNIFVDSVKNKGTNFRVIFDKELDISVLKDLNSLAN